MTFVRRAVPPIASIAFIFSLAVGFARDAAQSAVDWSQFLARHDLVWDSLPKTWDAGAFIGNGLLGAMIYSGDGQSLQWDAGRSDVVDRGERMAIGKFVLTPRSGNSSGGSMRLDLWNAEARGELRAGNGVIRWRSFTHANDLVNVIELTDPSPSKIEFQHAPAVPTREDFRGDKISANEINPDPEFGETGGVHWCSQSFKNGGGYVVAWAEESLSPEKTFSSHHRAFFFTVASAKAGKPDPAKALADIQSATKQSFDDLVASHRAWWHAYFPESFLSIPDTRMESFYWIQMYKLGSATRADRPAIDLMGPWFRRTPWPKFWWNLNIQLTYWPVYAANRLELGESLTRLIDENRQNLINNAPEEWRTDSAAIARSSSYDCVSHVNPGPGNERGNLTWTLHDYWLQYRYSGDEKLLADGLYPILKRAVGFYLHLLKPGADGRLHLPESLSPEYPKTAPDTTYDLALLRWGLQTLLAANDRLGLKDPLAGRWRDTLAKLTPYPVDPPTGFMIGAGQPLAISHRHFSHLLMVYPLHLLDPQSSADRPLIEKSLDHWIGFKGALKGYSYTGASAMCSWLGRKDQAARLIDEFLNQYVKPNTMYLEAGPVIETPLAGAASIHEMMLQSWSLEPFGTHIRVFPAVPDSWKDASFDKLRAEGAFEVSAVRRAGKTRFVQIKSLAGAPCRVSTGLAEPIAASGDRDFKVTTETDRDGSRVTTIDLRKGETVLLTPRDEKLAAADLKIEPVAAQPGRENFYGSPKNGETARKK